MAEVDIEVRLKAAKSINDFKELSKEFTKSASALDGNSAAFKRFAEGARIANNEMDRLKNSMRTDAGNAFRAFFKEQKLGNQIMGESAKSLKAFSDTVGGSALGSAIGVGMDKFQALEFAISGSATAMKGAGGSLGSFSATLSGMALPLTLIGTGLAMVVQQFSELEKRLETTRQEMAKFYRSGSKDYFSLTPEQQVAEMQKQRAALEREAMSLQKIVLTSTNTTLSDLARVTEAREQLVKKNQEIYALEIQIKALQAAIYAPKGTPAPVPDVVYPTAAERPTNRETFGSDPYLKGPFGASFKDQPSTRTKAFINQNAGLLSLRGVSAVEPITTEIQGVNDGVRMIGNTLASSLTEGFTRGFQTGESMLQTFAQSVLASIMGIAAQQTAILGISGILSLIPGVGAFGAIAGAMGSMFFNTSSGASASPISGVDVTNGRAGMQGELRGIKSAVQNLSLRVDNQGIYMASVRGEAAFTRA